jgi:hypothetical protein
MHETFVFISFKLAILPITLNIPQSSYSFLERAQRHLVASKTGKPVSFHYASCKTRKGVATEINNIG